MKFILRVETPEAAGPQFDRKHPSNFTRKRVKLNLPVLGRRFNQMRVLVIDDLRYLRDPVADDEAVYARTPEEGVRRLSTAEWDVIALDHDMGYGRGADGGFEEYDIWPCMEYIEQNADKFKDTTFWIVTSSPVGGDRIEAVLKTANLSYFRLDWREKSELFSGA